MHTAVSLLKPRYHLSYAAVIAAALLFAARLDGVLAARLVVLYLSFNVLLYGGIYVFNDVADARTDAAHPRKRERPIASGRVSLRVAVAAGTSLIAAGLLSAVLFLPPSILGAYVIALLLNAAYSGGGRSFPYIDIALNSGPHAVRFLIGVLLVGRTPPVGHLLAWFCLAAGIACVRRLIELEAGGVASRPSLRHYSTRGLSIAADEHPQERGVRGCQQREGERMAGHSTHRLARRSRRDARSPRTRIRRNHPGV